MAFDDQTIFEALYGHLHNHYGPLDDQPLYVDTLNPEWHINYKQLRTMVCRFAHMLQQTFQLQENRVIAIYTPNTIEYPALLHAIVAAGGVAAGIPRDTDVKILAETLTLVEPQWVVAHPDTLDNTFEAVELCGMPKDRILLLDRHVRFGCDAAMYYEKSSTKRARLLPLLSLAFADNDKRGQHPPAIALDRSRIDSAAYLYFTSGTTTGSRKASIITQRATLSSTRYQLASIYANPIEHERPYLNCNPLTNAGPLVFELHCLQRCGYIIYITPTFSPEIFCHNVERFKINGSFFGTWMAAVLANNPVVDRYDLSSCKWVVAAGAYLDPSIVDKVNKRIGTLIINQYGLTEILSVFHCSKKSTIMQGAVGQPNPDCTVKLIDEDGQEVPPGKEGELCVKGPTVTKGYYRNLEATKAAVDAEGYLHTGDICYIDKEGAVWFVNRRKDLIKYNLHHIAPSELEAVLMSHPEVADCCVIGIYSQEEGTEFPQAFVVLSHCERELEQQKQYQIAESIRKFVDQLVPDYKRLRAGVKIVQELPRNGTGKVQRFKLRDMAQEEFDKARKMQRLQKNDLPQAKL
ncbi:hypothetical protein BCR43DRAFT_458211 [Syncephalastrum racemosum]|uniref:Acetyl-CoA synthetase-like protein n=1 Tax=Syncephalastrum racemosum TaxID=13706 RepID=A0A1X2HCP9_SYNRA|nr:hypothetical protein BCR43DRAFT_458211 [Syncephalastrum racemosum]